VEAEAVAMEAGAEAEAAEFESVAEAVAVFVSAGEVMEALPHACPP
jgi:hypothetical protein